MMPSDVQLFWLLTGGLAPLFGAGILYLLWGVFKKLAAPGSVYRWRVAADPLGWLYGAILIAVQSAHRYFEAGIDLMGLGCIACSIACGMQLLAAMDERGASRNWQPSLMFQLMALFLVGLSLVLGYFSQLFPL
jgi:hypothetical protein